MIAEAVGGRITTYGPAPEFGREIRCFAEDHRGRLLAASDGGLLEFIEPGDPTAPGRWKAAAGALSNREPPYCLLVDSAGALWVGTEHGLTKDKDGKTAIYTTFNGLSSNYIHSLHQDRDGNLWIGTDNGGLCTLSGEPVVAFGKSDGLPDASIIKLFEDRSGRVYVSTRGGGLLELTDDRVVPVTEFNRTAKVTGGLGPIKACSGFRDQTCTAHAAGKSRTLRAAPKPASWARYTKTHKASSGSVPRILSCTASTGQVKVDAQTSAASRWIIDFHFGE
jgi:ligand-binding sensor domain-containing protein